MRFAVHWPGNPVASSRSHGVSRRDIPSRVHVSVAGETAGSAPEDGLALARPPVHMLAYRAALACVMRLNFLYSAWSFLLEAAYQQAPPGSKDFTVETGLLAHIPAGIAPCASCGSGHVLDHEGFDPDQVVPAGNICAGLFGPILAPVRLPNAQPGDGALHPPATFRAPLSAGELALQAAQPLLLSLSQTGMRSNAPVDRAADTATPRSIPTTSSLPGAGRRGKAVKATCQRPALSIVTRDCPAAPCGTSGTAPSHLRDPDFAGFPVQPTQMLGLERDNSESLVSPGLTPGGTWTYEHTNDSHRQF